MVSTATDNATPVHPSQTEHNPKDNADELNQALHKVQLRNKKKLPITNENSNGKTKDERSNEIAQNALDRAMGTLYEASPEMEDNNEEIRRLDNQLDHLNEYMEKVEKRLNAHNEKLKETLKQQREDREKRRKSFHERLKSNRQEDDDFNKQLNALLSQIVLSKRQSGLFDESVSKID